jgi:hypothetical protein
MSFWSFELFKCFMCSDFVSTAGTSLQLFSADCKIFVLWSLWEINKIEEKKILLDADYAELIKIQK